ncbi:MoaD/ThiS family protein [Flavobacterium hibernum]|uniref:Molybdopterin synthase sulfur carrier subunit n=1 Tax=Flavobacterium hibernum TaxID=37752 RepID=A0A0D0ERX0_9FLAO|nr:MoaD/ThiS family protein [Flavobacterium hibernum]KIO50933.1 thiamine biosynthesis protein ThiS [Flavobacterium hibernum]OXA84213.1 molybdopterin synthase sulfur carrier subunit [Flavobacterium hibernum]PTT02786.1 MoaD/ThiS family protein [Flavobacterium sp. HMWF030]STO10972.1 molybdopterin converting factor, subunit 1 [Flavobacterium hibernum]
MIEVKYFGAIAERTKCEFEKMSFSELSLQKLLQDLNEKYQFESLTFSIAINQKIVSKTTNYTLQTSDVVALLPPFAGG